MSFSKIESSQEKGLPASLFLFKYGSRAGDYFAYTDSDVVVTHGAINYTPIVIGRDRVESSGAVDDKALEIRMSPSAEIVTYLQTRTPTQKIVLEIRQGHVGDPDAEFLVVWVGTVAASARRDLFFELNCESILAAMARVGLRRTYQRGCSWALYGPQCRAVRRLFGPASPVRVGSNIFSVSSGWNGAVDIEKFLGGYVSWKDVDLGSLHQRTILSITSGTPGQDEVSILGKVEGMTLGTRINFYLGCNHRVDDCADLHNNILNYGGQPYIPEENPVGYVNRYY